MIDHPAVFSVSRALAAVAGVVLSVAMSGCERSGDRASSPGAKVPGGVAGSRITLGEADEAGGGGVGGEWRLQRGRLSDRYRLERLDGELRGVVDAAGIADRIAVEGRVEGEVVALTWRAAGGSEISDDGRADYEFRFEGRLTGEGIEGEAVLTGKHLANGTRVPVEEKFAARMERLGPDPATVEGGER